MHGIHEWVATSAMSNSLPTSPCRARIAGRGSRLILLRLCSSPPPSHLRHTTLPSISALRGKEEARAACVDSIISNVSNIYLLQSSLEDPSNEEILFFFFFKGKISLLELRRENRCSAVITRRLICPRRNYIHCSSLYLSAHKRGICLRDDYPRLARSFSPPPRRLGIPSVKNSSENISKEEEIFGIRKFKFSSFRPSFIFKMFNCFFARQ